jgi:hypothetical protein
MDWMREADKILALRPEGVEDVGLELKPKSP